MSRERKQSTEAAVREICRRTRRKFSPEEKVRIVLEGLRGEQSVSELCRREGIAANLYYRWSKDFLEAGKKQLAGGIQSKFQPSRPNFGLDTRANRAFELRSGSTSEYGRYVKPVRGAPRRVKKFQAG